ncbi:MAG: hypothetical protein A2V85_14925 [Chloroflexi bacterium RBG_16_72_14]|nr:MAG: hypothetical protein A2V85_14925 [Chloroflexi bacterium RBG_16_72_14]
MPRSRAPSATRKLNSPTWAIVAPSRIALRIGIPSSRPATALATALAPIATIASRTRAGTSPASAAGSTSMPTDTKNRTANRSRNGITAPAAWCDSVDSDTSSPATNAPRASDRPNTALETNAVSSAVANTVSRNSSGDPSRLTAPNSQGSSRAPTT